MSFWLELLGLIVQIIYLWLTKKQPTATAAQVAAHEQSLADMRKEAVKSRDLSALRAYRDALKNA